MVRNKPLHKSIKKTIISVFQFYKEKLTIVQNSDVDSINLFIALYKFEDQIKTLPDFVKSDHIMDDDSYISRLNGKHINTFFQSFIFEGSEKTLITFINKLYTIKPEYDKRIFEKEYRNFEDFFYDSDIKCQDSTYIYNFDFSGNTIDFGYGLQIKKNIERTPHTQIAYDYDHLRYNSILRSHFKIVNSYKFKKIIDSKFSALHVKPKFNKEYSIILNSFDLVILCLRILNNQRSLEIT